MKFGVSYFGNRMPWYVKEDLKLLKKDGFGIIVHTYSENDFRFYEKTMRDIAKISKDMGFEIWADPWGWGGVFGGEAFSGFLQHHMDQAQVGNDGRQKGSACFNSQNFREQMKQWIDATKDASFDAIFWDEPHFHIPSPFTDFPSVWTCRCDRCKKLFQEKYGYPMPVEYNEDVANFRNDTVVEFFSDLTRYAKEKTLKNVVCFLPFEMELFGVRDFEQITRLDFIDNIGTDPYWFSFGLQVNPFVEESAQKIERLSQEYNKENHMWLQGFKVPAGREEELLEGYLTIRNHKIDTLLFWGVYACKHISSIAPDDPEKTWQTVLKIVSGERK